MSVTKRNARLVKRHMGLLNLNDDEHIKLAIASIRLCAGVHGQPGAGRLSGVSGVALPGDDTRKSMYEFAGIYSEQGISGYKEARSGFKKIMEDVRAGKIDLIITKSISRFARNTVNVLKSARELKGMDVGIFSNCRTSTPSPAREI